MKTKAQRHKILDEIDKAVDAKLILAYRSRGTILTIHFLPSINSKTVGDAYTYLSTKYRNEIVDMYYVGTHAIRFYLYGK